MIASRTTSLAGSNTLPIRRLLQINVCLLLCASGIIFAAAEGSPLALLNVPIALMGLMLTDRLGVLRLSTGWANALGLVALLASGVEFFGEGLEGRLLAFGHLLVYLGWVLLLQKKASGQIWFLCALSVLQVATSAVLTNELWFPLTAMAYVMFALWTLSVFSLDRAVARSAGVERVARIEADSSQTASATGGASAEAERQSRSRSNVRLDSASSWITPRFITGVLVNGVLSILLGGAIFVLTPRIWASPFNLFSDDVFGGGDQMLTGFAEEITLGDMGEILENPNIVLEVECFDEQTAAPVDVEEYAFRMGLDAPLFRGKVLGNYHNGRWAGPRMLVPTDRFRVPPDVDLLQQQIDLHPIGTTALFALGNGMACRNVDADISQDLLSNTFTVKRKSRHLLRNRFHYTTYSTLSGEPPPLHRFRNSIPMRGQYELSLAAPPRNVERLRALARRLSRLPDGTILTKAQTAKNMLSHLRDSGEYGYTLNVSIDNANIDPVEDFLFNRKEGHCEYFASALALMLRSVAVATRLVSGFKGGDLNKDTGKFEVRQLHAHAWVEAYIDEEWVTLDPTPAAREVAVAGIRRQPSLFRILQRKMQSWWTSAVMMSQLQQQRTVYAPLKELFGGTMESIKRLGFIGGMTEWLKKLGRNPEEWISFRGFITVFVLGLFVAAMVWGLRRLWRLVSRVKTRSRRRSSGEAQVVEFYERFRKLVGRYGLSRDSARTHHEFARTIAHRWQQNSTKSNTPDMAALPDRLTSAFYRVRFGDEELTPVELQSLDASLGQLEHWLKEGRHRVT